MNEWIYWELPKISDKTARYGKHNTNSLSLFFTAMKRNCFLLIIIWTAFIYILTFRQNNWYLYISVYICIYLYISFYSWEVWLFISNKIPHWVSIYCFFGNKQQAFRQTDRQRMPISVGDTLMKTSKWLRNWMITNPKIWKRSEIRKKGKHKTINLRITWHWGAFMPPLL